MTKRWKTILYTVGALQAGCAAVYATGHSETVAFTPLNVVIAFAVFFAMTLFFVPMMRGANRAATQMRRFVFTQAGVPLPGSQAEWFHRNPMISSFIGK